MSQRRFRRTPGGVCSLGLHLMWWPKYRRRVLGARVAARCSDLLEQIAAGHDWEMAAREVMPDHVHLFVRVGPTDAPAAVVRASKGRTARVLRAAGLVSTAVRGRCCGRRRISPPRSATCETGLCVSVASDRAPTHRVGGLCGCTPRALQRSTAGTPGRLVAQQDPHLLPGSVRTIDRHPFRRVPIRPRGRFRVSRPRCAG